MTEKAPKIKKVPEHKTFVEMLRAENYIWNKGFDELYQELLLKTPGTWQVDYLLSKIYPHAPKKTMLKILEKTPAGSFANHTQVHNFWKPLLNQGAISTDDIILLQQHGVRFDTMDAVYTELLKNPSEKTYKTLSQWFAQDLAPKSTRMHFLPIVIGMHKTIPPELLARYIVPHLKKDIEDGVGDAIDMIANEFPPDSGSVRAKIVWMEKAMGLGWNSNFVRRASKTIEEHIDLVVGVGHSFGIFGAVGKAKKTAYYNNLRPAHQDRVKKWIDVLEIYVERMPEDDKAILELKKMMRHRGVPTLKIWEAEKERKKINQALTRDGLNPEDGARTKTKKAKM